MTVPTIRRSLLFAPSVRGVLSFVAVLASAACAAGQPAPDLPETLVVATRAVPPFAMKNAEGEWEGISIDLLRDFQNQLEADAGRAVPIEFREFSLEGMLDATAAGEVDLAAGALTVSLEREKRMDFTHPYYSSGLGVAVSTEQVGPWRSALSALLSPMFLQLVATLLVVLLIVGVLVYFAERKRNQADFGGGPGKGVSSGIWWAAVTLTTVGYGDKVPKSSFGRVVGFVWMFAGMFGIASFTAAVTSTLTLAQLTSRIDDPSDLSRMRVATVDGSTSEAYLRRARIRSRKFDNVSGALQAVAEGATDAAVYDAPLLRYTTLQAFEGEVQVLPITFERQDYAFALPSGSPLREPFNRVVLQRISGEEWEDMLADYLGEDFSE